MIVSCMHADLSERDQWDLILGMENYCPLLDDLCNVVIKYLRFEILRLMHQIELD